jgi:type I restriction enzyme S subunit
MTAPWPLVPLRKVVGSLNAGVSVNSVNEVVQSDAEIGVLKVSCVSRGRFLPNENKKVVPHEISRVAESPKAGDIIISRANTFDLVGASGYVDRDHPNLFLSDKLWRLRLAQPNHDSPRWLIAFLNSDRMRRDLYRRATGTSGSMKNISKESLLAIEIARPPANVQALLGDVFAHFEALDRTLEELLAAKRIFKRGLMQQLLTGESRFPGNRQTKWQTATVGEIVVLTRRKVPKPRSAFLSAGVRSHGKGVFLKEQFQPEGIALDELFELKSRDLVVNITFGWEGALAIVPLAADGALVSHRFPTFEIDETKALVDYMRHIIRTPRFVFAVGVASPGGAGRNRVLNTQAFFDIPLRLPSLDEQQRIAELLNALDHEIDLISAQRKQTDAYKRGLLSRILAGEIVVP